MRGEGTAAPQGVRVSEWLLPGCSAQRTHGRPTSGATGGSSGGCTGGVFSEGVRHVRGVVSQRRWCRIARAGKGPEEAGAPGRRGDPGSASQEAPRPATAPRPELGTSGVCGSCCRSRGERWASLSFCAEMAVLR